MAKRSGHHRKTHLDGLTQRQREVLEQMALGKTNLEIAEDLGIGFESVKSHVSDILLRLDMTSREEAIIAWQDQHGVLSRLRRTATGFVLTGFGKAATAGLAAILAVGVIAAIFAMTGGGGDSDSKPPLDTYLLDDGREVNQALAEAAGTWGFPVVAPAGDEFRLASITWARPDPRLPASSLRVDTSIRSRSEGEVIRVFQHAFESEQGGRDVPSGRPDVWIRELESGPGRAFAGTGRGRGFIISKTLGTISDEEAVAVLLALFDAAPGVLPAASPGPQRLDLTPTPEPATRELVTEVTDGADFLFDGTDDDEALEDASNDAEFDLALPGDVLSGYAITRVRVPRIFARDDIRSAYISVYNPSDGQSVMIAQHNVELVEAGEEWSRPLTTGRADIRAWRIGDLEDNLPMAMSIMAIGKGRTVASFSFSVPGGGMTEQEALRLLISTLEAVP